MTNERHEATNPRNGDRFVADADTLRELVAEVSAVPEVAVDTEFVRESTYFPELCLIQIGVQHRVACVDCLAGLDLTPLLSALTRPQCAWILHSARQDLEVVWNLSRVLPPIVIDTQVAAALLGFPPQIGLQGLLADVLGIELDKEQTRADWSRRPLPEAALRYAFDDVRYLHAAWRKLEARLAELGRLEWFVEDCKKLVAEPPVADIGAIVRRLKAVGALPPHARAAALALTEWRERRARSTNRPRRWILADDDLVRLSRSRPSTIAELRGVENLPRGLVARSGQQLLAVLESSDTPERRAVMDAVLADRKPDRNLVTVLQEALKRRATELGISAEVLATRKDINALAAGSAPQRVFSGWRLAALAPLFQSLPVNQDPTPR